MNMGKKIGKYIFIFLYGVFSPLIIIASQPVLSLKMVDNLGRNVDSVSVGMPFTIEAEVSGDVNALAYPSIENMGGLRVENSMTSSSIRTINGSSLIKKTRRYTVRSSDEGVYTIGPAVVSHNGNEIKSNTIQCVVSHVKLSERSNENELVFFKIMTNKSSIYIGEMAVFTVRFYYQGNDIKLDGIQEPKFIDCKASSLKGPTVGDEIINGISYRYFEWSCRICPEKIGEFNIPALYATYNISGTVNTIDHNDFDILMNFSDFFGNRKRSYEVYSNSLQLHVLPLPKHDSQTKLIGAFSSYNAQINLESASVGEGIVYSLELIGDSQVEMVPHQSLVLPNGLTFYESNTKVKSIDSKNLLYKKDFEYIIQAIEPGDYNINPQKIFYFDSNSKTYKTLQTKSVSFSVHGKPISQNSNSINIQDKNPTISTDLEQNFVSDNEGNRLMVETSGSWYGTQLYFISWWWYICGLVLFFIILIMFFLKKIWHNYCIKNKLLFKRNRAFSVAYKKLNLYKDAHDMRQLYNLMIELFADRYKITVADVTEEFMENVLRQHNYSSEKLVQWNVFIQSLARVSYTEDNVEYYGESETKLFNQVHYWLSFLERVI